ncbi:MAG: CotH kinase family protein, partial [Spirochaetota bacterium]|nr:CotH kinase family protein [Spirochaetota bacterium]
MKMLGLKYVTPKDYSEYFDMNTGMFEIRNYISLDLSLLKYKNEWSPSTNIDQENLPSSIILDEKIIKKGIPTLSIVIDNVDLYDQATGIFRNSLKKGRNWERPCFVSYYNKGDLLFATGAGVRVHGGASRKHNIRSLVFSLRLYFRNIYRLNKFRNGILFDSGSDPLRHLVVRKDGGGGYHFLNHMAYEISNHIGCITPQTEPVRVFLNGSRYGHGNYVLTEHLSREYLVSHYGHDNFVLVRTAKRIRTDKAKKARANEYLKILKWAKNKDIKMT